MTANDIYKLRPEHDGLFYTLMSDKDIPLVLIRKADSCTVSFSVATSAIETDHGSTYDFSQGAFTIPSHEFDRLFEYAGAGQDPEQMRQKECLQ